MRAFSLHITSKRHWQKRITLDGYTSPESMSQFANKHNKKPTIVDNITAFLLPAYLKRIECIDKMSSFN